METQPECEQVTNTEDHTDQIVWVVDALGRYAKQLRCCQQYPGVSRHSTAAKFATTLEIMDIFGIEFNEASASNTMSMFREFDRLKKDNKSV